MSNEPKNPIVNDLDVQREGGEHIGSTTPLEYIINALSTRGCADLTSSIKLATCSKLPIAGGGFCDVYRGTIRGGTNIAIKTLRMYDRAGKDNDREKSRMLKRAARELYYWSKLKHPNVLALMGLAMFRGQMAMISEWMERGSLMAYIAANPSVNRINLCMGICAGLCYIHENEMVHGDLKAANVMVSQTGIAMIADFGNSQLRDLSLKFTNTTSSLSDGRYETMPAMAPELLLADGGPNVSKKADIYAYGMTVLEALTGKVPYEEFGERKVLLLVAFERKAPARPYIGTSNELWAILQSCWAWDALERPEILTVAEQLQPLVLHSLSQAKSLSVIETGWYTSYNLHPSLSEITGVTKRTDTTSRNPSDEDRHAVDSGATCQERDPLGYAIQLYAEALPSMTLLFGVEHPDTLQCMANLATMYVIHGQLDSAEVLGAELIAAQKKVLGEGHPHTLKSMSNLALLYYKQRRYTDAELLNTAALASLERVLGEEHPDTLRVAANLAATYLQQNRLPEAESLGTKVLNSRKRLLDSGHPETVKSEANLALTYYKQNRLADALPLFSKVLAILKRERGERHPDTLRCTADLAAVYLKQGQLADAEALGVWVLAMQKRELGEYHFETRRSMANLALTHEKQGRLAEARALYRNSMATQMRALGDNHPKTTHSIPPLGYV